MKRKLLIIAASVIVIFSVGIFYLNNFYLPKTLKKVVVGIIEDNTRKKVTLGAVRVNIFKGLVLSNLDIYDAGRRIISIKEASCIFWVWGLMQKKVVIPSVTFNSAVVLLERQKDGKFNLEDMFVSDKDRPLKGPPIEQAQGLPAGGHSNRSGDAGFSLDIHKVNILNSTLQFADNTFAEPFSYGVEDIDLVCQLSLPNALNFNGSAKARGSARKNIRVEGRLILPDNALTANVALKNINAAEFSDYFASLGGGKINKGSLGLTAYFFFKDDRLNIQSQAALDDFSVALKGFNAVFYSQIKSEIEYDLNKNTLGYSGRASLSRASVSGVDFVGAIQDLSADVKFDNQGVSSENIKASAWGIPLRAGLILKDFSRPELDLNLSATLGFPDAQRLLKEKVNFNIPGEFKGSVDMSARIYSDKKAKGLLALDGSASFKKVFLKLDNIADPFEDIGGVLSFSLSRAEAKELNFNYCGVPYKASFTVSDFNSPYIKLKVGSEGLLASAELSMDKNKVNIPSLAVKYINSEFSASGRFDYPDSRLNLAGSLLLDLRDLHKPLSRYKETLDKINPSGDLHVKFNLDGNVRDLQSALIEVSASGQRVSCYGLSGKDVVLYLRQEGGILDLPFLNFSLYSGLVSLSGKANINAANKPFWVNLSMQDVNIQELKADTVLKEKDISGIVNGDAKLNGFFKDLLNIYGSGNLSITKGRLWELNIFKGLGKLLFSSDFANIVFHEGSCSFSLGDKHIWTNDLMLKSNMAYLSGRVKIGFDSSIDAGLNIDIIDELVPLSGTAKDLTTAIIGKSGKFATINISGTLNEPRYKFKPIVENIFKGITDTLKKNFFGKQQE